MIRKLSKRPWRMMVYGTPSVGKTTLAGSAPRPVLVCCEDGAREVEVNGEPLDAWEYAPGRFVPESTAEVRTAISSLAKDPQGFKTLVLEGLGTLDKLIQKELCDANPKWGGNFMHEGYGKPEAMLFGKWREIVVELERANNAGLNVMMVGHAAVSMHTPPDAPPFNRYQVAVTGNKTSDTAGFFFEWCDTVAFCRFQEMTTTDANKKKRGIGVQGARIMHLARTDSYDAKTRAKNAPAQIPMSWAELDRVMRSADVDTVGLRAQFSEFIPKLPADKQAAVTAWLASETNHDILARELDRLRAQVMLSTQQ